MADGEIMIAHTTKTPVLFAKQMRVLYHLTVWYRISMSYEVAQIEDSFQ